nr:MAG TPA: hypothetical protein [Caudoviricetes sp.]
MFISPVLPLIYPCLYVVKLTRKKSGKFPCTKIN